MSMFGNLGKMGEMMMAAKKIQDEMKRARYETVHDGVRAVINGEMEIIDLFIPPDLKIEKIGPAVRAAVNQGLKTAKEDMAKKMSKLTGGLQLPGM